MSDSVRPHRRQPTRLLCPWDSPGKNTGVGCHFLLQWMRVKSESEVAQSYPTLSNPMDCSLPGSSVHGTFQARVLKWGAIAFSTWYLTSPIKGYALWTANTYGALTVRQSCAFCFVSVNRYYRYPHYTVVETETDRVNDLPKITQLESGSTEI